MLLPAISRRAKEAESGVLSVFTSWCGHKGEPCVSLNSRSASCILIGRLMLLLRFIAAAPVDRK